MITITNECLSPPHQPPGLKGNRVAGGWGQDCAAPNSHWALRYYYLRVSVWAGVWVQRLGVAVEGVVRIKSNVV